VNEYLADLQAGIEEISNAAPQTEEERLVLFRLKKRIEDTFVKRVTIDKDRELSVEIRQNLLDIIEEVPHSSAVYFGKDGILYPYTRYVPRWGGHSGNLADNFFGQDINFLLQEAARFIDQVC
jgi:hypothetical protein